jgi:hypothetical protein
MKDHYYTLPSSQQAGLFPYVCHEGIRQQLFISFKNETENENNLGLKY